MNCLITTDNYKYSVLGYWILLSHCWVMIVLQGFSNVLRQLVFLETTQNRDKQRSRNFSTEQPQQEDSGLIFVFSLKVQFILFLWNIVCMSWFNVLLARLWYFPLFYVHHDIYLYLPCTRTTKNIYICSKGKIDSEPEQLQHRVLNKTFTSKLLFL